MANPKQKRSRSHIRVRRRLWKLRPVALTACPHCKHPRKPHYACPQCGYYNGRPAVIHKDEATAGEAQG
jgi:large subunit ribosomal protein L32